MDEANKESSFNLNLKVLQAFGYWQPNAASSKLILNAYGVYAACMIGIFYFVFVATEISKVVLVLGDLEKMTDSSFLLLTHTAQSVKLYYFIMHHDRVKNLVARVERPTIKLEDQLDVSMVERAGKNYRMFYRVFLGMAMATCVLWAVFPLIERDGGDQVRMPLSAWYPFSVDQSPMLEIIYLYQVMGAIVNAAANVSMDALIAGIMCHLAGQLDVLNNSLERIRKRQRQKEPNPEEALLTCVAHHKDILNMVQEVRALFSTSLLGQFVISGVIICLTMFKLTLVSLKSLQFVSMVLYQGCMLIELALYCWFGNEIILKSSQLTTSAYNSEWTDYTMKYKNDLLFIMVRTGVPIKLYAGNFFTLSLETFVTILRTSWSYFAVLNSVHS